MDSNPRVIAKELQVAISSQERTLFFHGESMRPFLVEGDEVIVEPVAWGQIRIGDIITYRYLDRFPTRRVVRKTATGLILWCDNWPWRVFSAASGDVLGRATARRRGHTWLSSKHFAWHQARWTALFKYTYHKRVMPINWWIRDLAGKLVRRAGLRRAPREG